jgi:hypothetical protein
MPGSIKIDDGSGNYTILTNAGSLGSDKTITIPNETATLATTTATDLGGLVKLASATASASSELLFDNFVDHSTYGYYKIVYNFIKAATDNKEFRLIFRQGGASGSDVTGTYRRYNNYANTASTDNLAFTAAETDHTTLHVLGNSDREEYTGYSDFFPANGTNGISHTKSLGTFRDPSGTNYANVTTNLYGSATAVTGIKFTMESGNITSGSITIYGVKL